MRGRRRARGGRALPRHFERTAAMIMEAYARSRAIGDAVVASRHKKVIGVGSETMTPSAPLFGWMMGAVGEDGASDATLYQQHDVRCRSRLRARLRRALGGRASFLELLSDAEPARGPVAHRGEVSRLRARHGGHRDALAPSAAHRRRDRDAEPACPTAPLRIGLGRGMAPLEYETFGVSLFEAKDRFEEIREIIRLALKGKPFTYHGKHYKIERETTLRPTPRMENVRFFGAISQPSSAGEDRRSRSAADDDGTGAPRGAARNPDGLGRRDASARRQSAAA